MNELRCNTIGLGAIVLNHIYLNGAKGSKKEPLLEEVYLLDKGGYQLADSNGLLLMANRYVGKVFELDKGKLDSNSVLD